MHLLKSANDWNDRIAENLLRLQAGEKEHRDYGGIMSPEKGFAEPAASARAADVFLSAYYSPLSRYHQQARILRAAVMSLEHLLRNQHEDGTLDLLETNFHDATCNAFCVQVLAYTWRMVQRYSHRSKEEDAVSAMLSGFLSRSADAMVAGGFHTPNHRWVMASALMLLWRDLEREDCRRTALLYLDEGIDCDEEGEYTEHSVGIYDIACNQSLLIILRECGMPELLEPVLRNLDKLTYYIEPDGSVATLNSRRQDFGRKLYPYGQLLNCLYVLAVPHNPEDERMARVAGLAEYLFRLYEEHAHTIILPQDAGNFVTHFLLNKALAEPGHPGIPLLTGYRRLFSHAGVMRWRNGNATLTLVRDRPVFCKLQVGKTELTLRAGACFYACGQFVGTHLEEIAGGYRLSCSNEWGYVRPLGKKAGTTDWALIPHGERERVNMLTLEWTLDALVYDNRAELRFRVSGCDNLPWKLEGILTPGGMLHADGACIPAVEGGHAFMAGGFEYTHPSGCLRWEGGLAQHLYGPAMRNTPAQETKAFTVYVTGFAPSGHTVTLSWREAEEKA